MVENNNNNGRDFNPIISISGDDGDSVFNYYNQRLKQRFIEKEATVEAIVENSATFVNVFPNQENIIKDSIENADEDAVFAIYNDKLKQRFEEKVAKFTANPESLAVISPDETALAPISTTETKQIKNKLLKQILLYTTSVAAGLFIISGLTFSRKDVPANSVNKVKQATMLTSPPAALQLYTNAGEALTKAAKINMAAKTNTDAFDLFPPKKIIGEINSIEAVEDNDVDAEIDIDMNFNSDDSKFHSEKFNSVFANLGKRESGNNYKESPFSSSHAFGKYQFMPETMCGWEYLSRVDENPELRALWDTTKDAVDTTLSEKVKQKRYKKFIADNWKEQSTKSNYMTICYKGKITNYQWKNKDEMGSLDDFTNTKKGHKLQEDLGRDFYSSNSAYLDKNASHLYNTFHVVEISYYTKDPVSKKDVLKTRKEPILVTAAGMRYGSHLLGAKGMTEVVENGFNKSKNFRPEINSNIETAIEYNIRGTNAELKAQGSKETYYTLLYKHPEYIEFINNKLAQENSELNSVSGKTINEIKSEGSVIVADTSNVSTSLKNTNYTKLTQ